MRRNLDFVSRVNGPALSARDRPRVVHNVIQRAVFLNLISRLTHALRAARAPNSNWNRNATHVAKIVKNALILPPVRPVLTPYLY